MSEIASLQFTPLLPPHSPLEVSSSFNSMSIIIFLLKEDESDQGGRDEGGERQKPPFLLISSPLLPSSIHSSPLLLDPPLPSPPHTTRPLTAYSGLLKLGNSVEAAPMLAPVAVARCPRCPRRDMGLLREMCHGILRAKNLSTSTCG